MLILLLSGSCLVVGAQVVNDNIENRLLLEMNVPLESHTRQSTVQWKCLNQDLTRSCVKFHNDQWFEFIAESDQLFINISGQDCKDIWGVQLLVFSGIPCEPETYELVTCYSDGNKDDIFVKLTGLTPGERYLVNVDGYLHDLCSFDIELSDRPKGLPVAGTSAGRVDIAAELQEVMVSWELPEEYADEMQLYEVWRRTGERFEKVRTVPHQRNAFGEHQLSYHVTDTITAMQADYLVVAVSNSDRILVGEKHIELDRQEISMLPENLIDLEFSYEKGDPVSLELWDVEGDRLLKSYNFIYDPEKNARVSFRIMEYREAGIDFYKVVIRNRRTGEYDLKFFEK